MASSESGMTLMDLISADPSAPAAAPPPSTLGKPAAADRPPKPAATSSSGSGGRKRSTLMQIQSDTIAAAKALNPVRSNPQKQKKKPVSYAPLAGIIHKIAATSDQRNSQKQLANHVFLKLAVYNSVDPSLAPSLLMSRQQCEDRNVLLYVYYYLARILSDTGVQGVSAAGGIPTPNWDALADIDAVRGVTRADVVPCTVDQLTSGALNAETECNSRYGSHITRNCTDICYQSTWKIDAEVLQLPWKDMQKHQCI